VRPTNKRFFAAAPENKRVATFQATHDLSGLRVFNEYSIDVVLLHGVARRFFADENFFGVAAHFFKQLFTDKAVVNHDVGTL
jgi:hypothetical protein